MHACICVIVRVSDFAEDIELNALKDLQSFHLGTDFEGQGSLWNLGLIFNCSVPCLKPVFFIILFQMKNFRSLSSLNIYVTQLRTNFNLRRRRKHLTFSLSDNIWDVNMELSRRLTNHFRKMKGASI